MVCPLVTRRRLTVLICIAVETKAKGGERMKIVSRRKSHNIPSLVSLYKIGRRRVKSQFRSRNMTPQYSYLSAAEESRCCNGDKCMYVIKEAKLEDEEENLAEKTRSTILRLFYAPVVYFLNSSFPFWGLLRESIVFDHLPSRLGSKVRIAYRSRKKMKNCYFIPFHFTPFNIQ